MFVFCELYYCWSLLLSSFIVTMIWSRSRPLHKFTTVWNAFKLNRLSLRDNDSPSWCCHLPRVMSRLCFLFRLVAWSVREQTNSIWCWPVHGSNVCLMKISWAFAILFSVLLVNQKFAFEMLLAACILDIREYIVSIGFY